MSLQRLSLAAIACAFKTTNYGFFPSQAPWNATLTTVILLLTGVVLALLKWVLAFFPLPLLLTALLYFGAGYLFGRKVFDRSWAWGVVLALPAMLLNLYILSQLHFQLETGTGFRTALFLVLMPIAACVGINLRCRTRAHHAFLDNTLLNN